MSSFSVGKLPIPIGRFEDPRPDIAARAVNEEHVQRVLTSINNYGLRPAEIHIFVAVRVEDSASIRAQLLAIPDLKERTARLLAIVDEQKLHMETIGGQHTRTAIERKAQDFLQNKWFQAPPADVYVLDPTPDNRMALAYFGVTDNIVRGVQMEMKMVDYVVSMREMRKHHDIGRGGGGISKVAFLKHFIHLGLKLGTAKGYLQLAEQPDEIFEPLLLVMRGEVNLNTTPPRAFKAPGGFVWFTRFCAQVDDESLAAWLKALVSGEIRDIRAFEYRVQRYVCVHKLSEEVVKLYFKVDKVGDYELDDVYKDLPGSADVFTSQFFLSYYKSCWEKYQWRLSPAFLPRVDELIKNLIDENRREQSRQVSFSYLEVFDVSALPLFFFF